MKKAYTQHKSNSKQRDIAFNLTYEEWLSIWQQSGHIEERGRGAEKYCMCRYGDSGAYEVGNVFIGLGRQNVRDGNLGKPCSDEHKAKIAEANKGKQHPWSEGKKNPMHRPEVKAKIAEAIGGTKHYRSKGGVTTPSGFFESTVRAAESLGIPLPTVQWRCKNNKFGFSYGNQPAFA